ncbi:MAG: hypothetical protein QOJ09_332, partial [Actinomycetota bacterium]|nr:hypothetical protein [Actinomycetota bacterium]
MRWCTTMSWEASRRRLAGAVATLSVLAGLATVPPSVGGSRHVIVR